MNEFLEKIRKMQALDKQIEAEREAETEKVNKMTDEQRLEYLKEKEERAAVIASELGMNKKQVIVDDNKGD